MEEALEQFLAHNTLGTFLLDPETEQLLKDVQEKRTALRIAELKATEHNEELRRREDELKNLENILTHVQVWDE